MHDTGSHIIVTHLAVGDGVEDLLHLLSVLYVFTGGNR